MNIKQLKEKIKDLPDHLDVFIKQTDDEFPYSLSNESGVENVKFYEGGEDGPVAYDDVFVITDCYVARSCNNPLCDDGMVYSHSNVRTLCKDCTDG